MNNNQNLSSTFSNATSGGGLGSRSGSASHGIKQQNQNQQQQEGLIAFTNFERTTANARKQTSKYSFPLNPSPTKPNPSQTSSSFGSPNNNNNNNQQRIVSVGKSSVASSSISRTSTQSKATSTATATTATTKPVFIPPFLRKFAKVPPAAVPAPSTITTGTSNDEKTSSAITKTATVLVPSETEKQQVESSTTKNGNDEKIHNETTTIITDNNNNDKEQNNNNNNEMMSSSAPEEAKPSSSYNNPFALLQSPESLHETLRIFHTNKRYIPVIDFESLGCFAFQLFSALHLMHDELPHLTVVSSSSNNNNVTTSPTFLSPNSLVSSSSNNNSPNLLVPGNNQQQQQQSTTTVLICSGYVHNDLHSGNILVRVDDRRICLCDFEHVSDVVVDRSSGTSIASASTSTCSSSSDLTTTNNNNSNNNNTSSLSSPTKKSSSPLPVNSLLDVVASSASSPFRITPRAYTPPELVSTPKRDVWAATLIVFEMFLGICPLVNALEAGNDMSDCYLTVHEEFGLDWRHFAQLLKDYDESPSSLGSQLNESDKNSQGDLSSLENSTTKVRNHKKEFLDFCSKGLTNNPVNRATAKQMLNHPFLAKKSEKEWEKAIRVASPYWKQI